MIEKKENVFGYYGQYWTAKSLSSIWEKIEDDDLTALEISLKGDEKITFKQQFEAYYNNCILREQDLNWAKATFFKIFEENRLIIEQIKRHKNEIENLKNPENWQNNVLMYSVNKGNSTNDTSAAQSNFSSTKSTSQDGGKDSTIIDNNNYAATNSATSDSNSQYDDTKDYEEQPTLETPEITESTGKESKIPKNPLEISILGNQLSQNRSINVAEKELILNKGTSNLSNITATAIGTSTSIAKNDRINVMVGKNIHTNKALESLNYLRAEIPMLRTKFIAKFSGLFII